jgi:hypothetical protein
MSISFIKHRGKNILYIDYSNCKTKEDTILLLEQTREFYLNSSEMFYCLNNFTNCASNNEYMDLAKKYAKEAFANRNIKEACFGISNIQRILLAAYNLVAKDKIALFNTKEEALNYLVS